MLFQPWNWYRENYSIVQSQTRNIKQLHLNVYLTCKFFLFFFTLVDETKSTVSDAWSTDVLASDSEPPEQNQFDRLEEIGEEIVRQNLLARNEVETLLLFYLLTFFYYSWEISKIHWNLNKTKTCLSQTDFTVPSTRCLCNKPV